MMEAVAGEGEAAEVNHVVEAVEVNPSGRDGAGEVAAGDGDDRTLSTFMEVPTRMDVKPSTIAGAGRGLFALVNAAHSKLRTTYPPIGDVPELNTPLRDGEHPTLASAICS